jgi:hypothetical protein
VSDRVVSWVLRGLWVPVAFVVWPAISAGLRHETGAVRTTAAVGGWVVWAAVLVATLVPAPVSLTVLRCAAPAALAAAIAAAVTGNPSTVATALAAAWSAVVVIAVFLPATAILFVNGPAYPNERRFPIAPPGALLLGPIELAWGLLVGLPVAAALTLADSRWILGGVLAAVALPVATMLGRALHGLSRRWLVFVPAGLVIHDPMSLGDPVLFPRQVVESLGPAPAGSDSLDLTRGAAGLALELRLLQKVPMVLVRGRSEEQGASARLLVTPSRPGRVLSYADGHQIPVAIGAA